MSKLHAINEDLFQWWWKESHDKSTKATRVKKYYWHVTIGGRRNQSGIETMAKVLKRKKGDSNANNDNKLSLQARNSFHGQDIEVQALVLKGVSQGQ